VLVPYCLLNAPPAFLQSIYIACLRVSPRDVKLWRPLESLQDDGSYVFYLNLGTEKGHAANSIVDIGNATAGT
jgi:hypothetical protein